MLHIAIVDDEAAQREQMQALCRDYGQKKRCQLQADCFDSGEAFLQGAQQTAYSIVFMDIYMQGISGVQAARQLRQQSPACLLVFLTTSLEFMPEAFACHAFDYIAKPIRAQRVEQVLEDALRLLPPPAKFVELCCERRTVRVFLQQILCVVTDAHYLELALADGTTLRCRMTVPEFLRQVGQDDRFLLANRGVLLNAEHISAFADRCCILDDGRRLPLRVRDAGRLEQAVRDYHFETIRRQQRAEEQRSRP